MLGREENRRDGSSLNAFLCSDLFCECGEFLLMSERDLTFIFSPLTINSTEKNNTFGAVVEDFVSNVFLMSPRKAQQKTNLSLF